MNDLLDSETWEPQTVCHETLRKSNSQNPVVLRGFARRGSQVSRSLTDPEADPLHKRAEVLRPSAKGCRLSAPTAVD